MTKTKQIFELSAPYNNQFQGVSMRALFVCSAGILRSPTAATVAAKLGFNARSCGSDIECALVPVSANLIFWATRIYFLNRENYNETLLVFKDQTLTLEELQDKAVVWNIEDQFNFMDPVLVAEIERLLTT